MSKIWQNNEWWEKIVLYIVRKIIYLHRLWEGGEWCKELSNEPLQRYKCKLLFWHWYAALFIGNKLHLTITELKHDKEKDRSFYD